MHMLHVCACQTSTSSPRYWCTRPAMQCACQRWICWLVDCWAGWRSIDWMVLLSRLLAWLAADCWVKNSFVVWLFTRMHDKDRGACTKKESLFAIYVYAHSWRRCSRLGLAGTLVSIYAICTYGDMLACALMIICLCVLAPSQSVAHMQLNSHT